MKGGCFSKILTFVFGVIIGFVLLAGTLAGGVYFLATSVTVNDVENMAKTEFPFIDKEAEIRDKSLYDIVKLAMSKDFKNITVQEVKTTFGIDVPKIIEDTLDVTINEESRNELNSLPILQVFQGDNLKIVLNCVTLEGVLTKAGVDKTTLDSKPLIAERYQQPVIDAFNAILLDLDFNKLSIGELEYLIGLDLGGGILDSIRDKKLSELGDAVNTIKLENIIPDFDRDTYIKLGDEVYYLEGYKSLVFKKVYDLIPTGVDVPFEERYNFDEKTGVVSQADNGAYYLLPEYKALGLIYEDFYAYDGATYNQNRHGAYVTFDELDNFVKANDKFTKNADNTYTKDKLGLYYQKFTTVSNGTDKYQYSYVKNFVEVDGKVGEFTLEKRGLKKVADYKDGNFKIVTTSEVVGSDTIYTNNLVETTESVDGVFVLKLGTTENILQAFADMTLNSIDSKIGNVTIGEIIEIDESSPEILKALKNSSLNSLPDDVKTLELGQIIKVDESSPEILKALQHSTLDTISTDVNTLQLQQIITIDESSPKILKALKASTLNTLSSDIQNVKISDIIDVVPECIVEQNALGSYVAIKGNINDYLGCYKTGKVKDTNEIVYLVSYQDGLDNNYFDLTKRYNIVTEASSGILKSLGALTVQEMQTNLQSKIDESTLGDVLDIDGDLFFITTYKSFSEVEINDALNIDNYFVFVDTNKDIMRNIENTDTNTTIYKRVYVGTNHALMKKMYNIKITNIAGRIETIINETRFDDIIEINPYYIIKENPTGAYIALPDGEYFGTYKEGHLENDNTIIKFVSYNAGVLFAGKRYDIVDEQSSGALVKLNDSKIGNLTDGSKGLQSVIDSCKLSDVLDIDGNVYVKLSATNFAGAQAEVGTGNVYYRDNTKGNLFYIADSSTVATEFYKLFYSGKSNAMLRRLADLTVQDLGKGDTINKVVNDCTIRDLGVETEPGSLLNGLADTRICDLDKKVQDMLNNSTMANLNAWGNLGLTEAQLNIVCNGKKVGEMNIQEFIVAAIEIIDAYNKIPKP